MEEKERNDLIISWLTISAAFAVLMMRRIDIILAIPMSLITVGTGFILHELAHRQVAHKFGAEAEYRAWSFGLVIALASAFFGFIFAAPGAVYIYGPHIDTKKNGLISLAGPATNLVIALIFMLLYFISPPDAILKALFSMGTSINFFLAMFNLLPFGPLDGLKVFVWSKGIWAIAFIIAIAGTVLF